VHGTFALLSNGSILLTPFGDGYQQIQSPCAAVSNFIENYNNTELYMLWQIFTDPVTGYKLHLFEADGTPVAPQFQVSIAPNSGCCSRERGLYSMTIYSCGYIW